MSDLVSPHEPTQGIPLCMVVGGPTASERWTDELPAVIPIRRAESYSPGPTPETDSFQVLNAQGGLRAIGRQCIEDEIRAVTIHDRFERINLEAYNRRMVTAQSFPLENSAHIASIVAGHLFGTPSPDFPDLDFTYTQLRLRRIEFYLPSGNEVRFFIGVKGTHPDLPQRGRFDPPEHEISPREYLMLSGWADAGFLRRESFVRSFETESGGEFEVRFDLLREVGLKSKGTYVRFDNGNECPIVPADIELKGATREEIVAGRHNCEALKGGDLLLLTAQNKTRSKIAFIAERIRATRLGREGLSSGDLTEAVDNLRSELDRSQRKAAKGA